MCQGHPVYCGKVNPVFYAICEAHALCVSALFFLSATGKGIRIEYQTITLHAVARGDASPKVYCQLSENTEDLNDNEEESENNDAMRELNLVPSDPSSGKIRVS